MTHIRISEEIMMKIPGIQLFCIECDVQMKDSPSSLWNLIREESARLSSCLKLEDISSIPAIKASRAAYKACGKDPARYRLSAEALLRRTIKGEELYRLGNVVDLLNLVSLSSGFSIGGYDAEKIRGEVWMGVGEAAEPYTGIGRGELNIEGLPVFRDEAGAFGSPTSDSERTCVDNNTGRFLMVIIDFGAPHLLQKAGDRAVKLLQEFAEAKNMEINIVKG